MGLETTMPKPLGSSQPSPRETAMGQRQPMACEIAAAKTVTSASKWPASPPHANAIVPVGRCR
jgi:hypothetical protein